MGESSSHYDINVPVVCPALRTMTSTFCMLKVINLKEKQLCEQNREPVAMDRSLEQKQDFEFSSKKPHVTYNDWKIPFGV